MSKESPLHKEIREGLGNYLKKGFVNREVLLAHKPGGRTRLPILKKSKFERHEILYEPDIIIKEKDCGNITHIIEIEDKGDLTTLIKLKTILAGFCIKVMVEEGTQGKKSRPQIIFVPIKNKISKKKLSASLNRTRFISQYLSYVEPEITRKCNTKDDAVKEIEELLKGGK